VTKGQAESLQRQLKRAFGGKVQLELIDQKRGRYRFAVLSKRFNSIKPLARQDRAWKVVDKTLPREAALDVSLILTYAPAELELAAAK